MARDFFGFFFGAGFFKRIKKAENALAFSAFFGICQIQPTDLLIVTKMKIVTIEIKVPSVIISPASS